jgi:threonine dehydrogenase-like Zn-dependent dehydrogenase
MKHKRIVVTHYGGSDALQVVEEECPEPKRGEVRIRVLAAGVSLPDIMAREGIHPETPPVQPATEFRSVHECIPQEDTDKDYPNSRRRSTAQMTDWPRD